MVLTLHHSLFFSGSYLSVLIFFAKKDKVPQMVPSISQVVFVTSPKAFDRASTSYSMACMWSFGYDKHETHLCHTMLLS
jgi:hypothetical protein